MNPIYDRIAKVNVGNRLYNICRGINNEEYMIYYDWPKAGNYYTYVVSDPSLYHALKAAELPDWLIEEIEEGVYNV